jgi:hypothetical protein
MPAIAGLAGPPPANTLFVKACRKSGGVSAARMRPRSLPASKRCIMRPVAGGMDVLMVQHMRCIGVPSGLKQTGVKVDDGHRCR